MGFRTRLAATVAAAALAAGGAVAASGTAHAATPVVDTTGVIGYQAVQNGNQTYYTDETSLFGLGDPQYSVNDPQLPVNAKVAAELNGLSDSATASWTPFSGGAGVTVRAARLGLCGGVKSYDHGRTVQLAIVPVTTRTYDVVAIAGEFAPSSGNACLDPTLPVGLAHLVLRNISDDDTMLLQLLFDGRDAHNGTGAGHASFYASDLSHPTSNQVNTSFQVFSKAGSEFYEADDGVLGVTGGTPTSALPGPVLPDSAAPDMVVREAHVGLDGNTIGGSEVRGTLQSDAAWTAVPDATENSEGIDIGSVSVFSNDHYSNFVAPGVFPASI
jgi:hypothetical protein